MSKKIINNITNALLDNQKIIDLLTNKQCKCCLDNISKKRFSINSINYDQTQIKDWKTQLYFKNSVTFYILSTISSLDFIHSMNLNKELLFYEFNSSKSAQVIRNYTINNSKLSKNRLEELFRFTLFCPNCSSNIMMCQIYTNKFPEVFNRKYK